MITDNGCSDKRLWVQSSAATETIVKRIRVRRPQAIGKVERFHRILLEEWAYIRPWTSERPRTIAYAGFIHFDDQNRFHAAPG